MLRMLMFELSNKTGTRDDDIQQPQLRNYFFLWIWSLKKKKCKTKINKNRYDVLLYNHDNIAVHDENINYLFFSFVQRFIIIIIYF